jgi:aryl-alcohol dehydrogenase-like predicted oxidoreductase
MEKRQLGKTDMLVSRLGAGLSEIGYGGIDTQRAAEVLNNALDLGINFLDTAACYLVSEEFVGQTVAHRRSEYYLATKAGHVAGGYEGQAWTAKTISDSIDRSLKRMKTDYLDLVQLHSCSLEVLEKGEAIETLQKAQKEGKTRYIGYSGDNEAAIWAVNSGLFDTLQTSFNLVEQKARHTLFDTVKEKNIGLIIKRPIANSAWGAASSPSSYADGYFERAQKLRELGPIDNEPADRILLALGFTFAHDAVDVAIVGTKTPNYVKANIDRVSQDLPIPKNVVAELQRRFDDLGKDWPQLT